MKVSLNWVRQFTDIELSTDDLVKRIGEQLGAVEEVVDLAPVYKDVIVAEIKKCEKHPNADKLSLCMIDDGGVMQNVERSDGLVQVVCGAPNVREGMKVAWLPPGAIVPSTHDKEAFTLEARELRGVVSNGMLASAKELAIGDEHDGILEIDVPCDVGQKFADIYQLNDTIIDIENKMFTHRPDCFGQLGVAREIAGISHKAFKSPDWYMNPLDQVELGDAKLPLAVQNDIPDLVPRFVCVSIADINVQNSPVMIRSLLSRVGIKPINNIVDITNYIMMLTGQPLHAYDYDKVAERTKAEGATIKAQHGDGKQSVKLLNGKMVTPRDIDMVIATDSELLGVGGVMGGADTEVDENTKNIILECANFDMYTIRRTSMGLGLFTDAVSRFNKGQSPLQNTTIIKEAMSMITSIAGGQIASEIQDAHGEVGPLGQVSLTSDFASSRLGQPIQADDIASLLKNVEFEVKTEGDTVHVTPPYWRTDIDISEDIVEEVGRLLGFHHLPLQLPQRTMEPVQRDRLLEIKASVRDILAKSGGNELLTYSFVHGDVLEGASQDKKMAHKIANALSPDLQYYRMGITPSLLDKVYGNIRAGYGKFVLFEIGKTHLKNHDGKDGLPKEEERVAAVVLSDSKQPAFYQARLYVDELLKSLGLRGVTYEKIEHDFEYEAGRQTLAPYDRSRTAVVKLGDDVLGIVGEFKLSTRKSFKLPSSTAGFELSMTRLLKENKFTSYKELSKFPSVTQDISLQVPKGTNFADIESFLNDNFEAPDNSSWQIKPFDIYEKADTKHMTFRLTIAAYDRTLEAEPVNKLLDAVAAVAEKELGTKRL